MPSPPGVPYVRRLRPGAPVLRRDTAVLQVGLDPPVRAVLPDTPAVRRMLTLLRTGCARPVGDQVGLVAWDRLERAGLLVPEPDRAAPAVAQAATAAWSGPDAGARLAARRGTRVSLHGPPALVEAVERLALLGGLDATGAGAEPRIDASADVVVLLHDGEAHRERHDGLVAAGRVHLPVWWRCGVPHLGPLVVPGVTACLRCVDAGEGEADPRRGLLLEQAAREPAAPQDPVLLALASAWLVRDLQRWAEGGAPTTWSATVQIGAEGAARVTPWARHPHCGCSWDESLTA